MRRKGKRNENIKMAEAIQGIQPALDGSGREVTEKYIKV